MKKSYIVLDKNFDKWQKWLHTMQSGEIDKMRDRVARTLVERGYEYARAYTPIRSRQLQNSMGVGRPKSLVRIQILPNVDVIFYGTTVEYAAAVEEGFKQKEGRFVPGEWRSGTFHYIPGAKTGMVLTGKVIEGRHMFEKSLDHLKDGDVEKAYIEGLRELWAMLTK